MDPLVSRKRRYEPSGPGGGPPQGMAGQPDLPGNGDAAQSPGGASALDLPKVPAGIRQQRVRPSGLWGGGADAGGHRLADAGGHGGALRQLGQSLLPDGLCSHGAAFPGGRYAQPGSAAGPQERRALCGHFCRGSMSGLAGVLFLGTVPALPLFPSDRYALLGGDSKQCGAPGSTQALGGICLSGHVLYRGLWHRAAYPGGGGQLLLCGPPPQRGDAGPGVLGL